MIGKEYEVPEMTNLIINDTPIDTELVGRSINRLKSRQVEFVVFDRQQLTKPLIPIIEDGLEKTRIPLGIIFPGQGAQKVKEVLPKTLLQDMQSGGIVYDTQTKREYIDNRPQLVDAKIPEDLVKKLDEREIGIIWIIDDVVATGQTIQGIRTSIREQLAEKQPDDPNYCPDQRFSYPQIKIPNIPFTTFTWFKQRGAKTQDIDILPSIVYFRRSGRVPLNSLSTILNEDIKGKAVKSAYASKYFRNYSEFFRFLESLEKLL